MNNSEGSSSFSVIAVLTLCGAIAVAYGWSRPVQAYTSARAASYASQAAHENNTLRAIGQYRLALALQPWNATYRLKLALLYANSGDLKQAVSILKDSDAERLEKGRLQLKLGLYQDAIKTLGPLESTKASILKSQALLEAGKGSEAVDAVEDNEDEESLVQLGMAYAVTDQTETADGLAHQVQRPDNVRKLKAAQSGGLALAQVLYGDGMYQSAKRILLASKEESSIKYALLAHIALTQPKVTTEDIQTAQDAAKKGLKLDPSNVGLHELLKDIDTKLEDADGAADEQKTIDRLRSGKI